jgi:lipopolysaccharide export system ATP-binding protein
MAMYQRARLGLGYLAQETSVFRKLTVEQNLQAILQLMTTRRGKPYRSTARDRKKRVDELLVQFRIDHLRKSISMTLSGGERRRLEIARCLVSEPMLIMLDEPFTGIDPRTVGDIQEIIQSLRDSGIGVLITDHHVRETLKITDRSYLVAEGRVLTQGSASDIINNREARELYLGNSFDDGGLVPAAAPAAPPADSVQTLLSSEKVREAIAKLGSDDPAAAAHKLRTVGKTAIPELLQAMQWNDLIVRQRAHVVLCEITGLQLAFEPSASESVRLRQLLSIRESLEPRKAG